MSKMDMNLEVPDRSGRNQVGVHLDLDALRVVEFGRGGVKDSLSVPYPPGMHPAADGFAEFLKKSVADIAGIRHAPVWAVGPVPSLQVRFLTLAKVRPRQFSNLVYWTFRKEIPFDAAQVTFDYDVEGEVATPGQAKRLDTTAYTVAHADLNRLRKIFDDAGLRLEGLMIPSFAMRALIRAVVPASGEPVVGLYVGDDSSSIMFVKNKQVVAHRVFKTGMNAMLDVLRDRHPDWSSAQAYKEMSQALANPKDDAAKRVSETVHATFSRLIQQVERSVSAYLVGRSNEDVKTIYVAGSLAGQPSLVSELGAKLGLASIPLNGFEGRMPLKAERPLSPEEAGTMAIALGAAMSDPLRTPNLLHTYVKREHEERVAHTSRLLNVCGVVGLVLLVAVNVAVSRFNRGLRDELRLQEEQIRKFAPYPDRAMIADLVTKATVNSAQLRSMAQRCLPVAAYNQLALNTPEDIRLLAIDLDLLGVAPAGRRGDPGIPAGTIRVLLEGVVAGDTGLQESKLASYIMRLEDSVLFNKVTLTKSEEGRDGRDQVLMFNLNMEVEPLTPPPVVAAVVKGGTP